MGYLSFSAMRYLIFFKAGFLNFLNLIKAIFSKLKSDRISKTMVYV